MNQKYTPTERLDILLFFIAREGHDYLEIEQGIWNRLLKDVPDLYIGIVPSHRIQMLRKLVKDGYVEKEENVENYRITFDGIIFKGYQHELEISLQADIEKRAYDSRLEKNQERLNYLTAFLMVATFLLATSEGIKIYEDYSCVFPYYLLIGLVLSTIGILLLKLPATKKTK